jgi:hypothetical protein
MVCVSRQLHEKIMLKTGSLSEGSTKELFIWKLPLMDPFYNDIKHGLQDDT